jgi:hypothetical protein
MIFTEAEVAFIATTFFGEPNKALSTKKVLRFGTGPPVRSRLTRAGVANWRRTANDRPLPRPEVQKPSKVKG